MAERSPRSPATGSTVDGETREIQSYMVFGTTFDVDANYTVVDAVGQGAYGIVWCVVATHRCLIDTDAVVRICCRTPLCCWSSFAECRESHSKVTYPPFRHHLRRTPAAVRTPCPHFLNPIFRAHTFYGSYTHVLSSTLSICSAAKDENTGDMVAIKKITNAFEHHTFAKRTLREITLMRMMQHENVRFRTVAEYVILVLLQSVLVVLPLRDQCYR